MKRIALLLFLHVSQAHFDYQKCVINHQSQSNVWEEKLNDKIMCNYDSGRPPKNFNNSDYILVNTQFVVKTFEFLSDKQEFIVFTWASISWLDDRLKWDPKDFDGIDETVKNSYKLWLPGIRLYNSISDLYDQSRSNDFNPFMLCRITSSGRIICITSVKFEAKCATDLSEWPFDTQVCSLEFGPWAVIGTKIHLDVGSAAVSFVESEYGAEWVIINNNQEVNQDAEVQVKIHFTMMRHAEGLAAIVIFPSILLSVITLSSLFMNTRHESRIYLACFSLLCHFYFLSELGMNIPEHSKSTPRILFFFRGSVIMTLISIVLTFLFKLLSESKKVVPQIIAIVNENVYETYANWFIRPRWEPERDDDDKRDISKAWIDFVSILNTLWIYVSVLVYIIMCCVFIPLPNGSKQNIRKMSYDFA